MLDDLLEFMRPVVAEFDVAGLTGWSVSAAEVESFVRFVRPGVPGQVDFTATVPAAIRWWIAPVNAYGATFAEAAGKARAEGWTP